MLIDRHYHAERSQGEPLLKVQECRARSHVLFRDRRRRHFGDQGQQRAREARQVFAQDLVDAQLCIGDHVRRWRRSQVHARCAVVCWRRLETGSKSSVRQFIMPAVAEVLLLLLLLPKECGKRAPGCARTNKNELRASCSSESVLCPECTPINQDIA